MRETTRDINGSISSNSLTENKVNTKTESLTLNGIEYLQMEESDLGAFIEARIKKSLVIQQLIREIESTLSDILVKKRLDENSALNTSYRRKSTRRVNAEIENDTL